MGTWARRVIEIKMADASFNFQEEGNLLDFLDNEIDVYSNLNDGVGMIDIPMRVLRKAVKKAAELNLSEKTIESLKEDIKAARLNKDESVTYSCF